MLIYNFSTNGEFHDSAVCESVGIGQEIHYKAEISIASCAQGNRNKKFKIKPADLSDSMIVDVEIICACECDDEVRKSSKVVWAEVVWAVHIYLDV